MYPLGDFLVLSAPVLRQIARYLPHSKDARFCVSTKTHPKSSHDKFKTASYRVLIGDDSKSFKIKTLSLSEM